MRILHCLEHQHLTFYTFLLLKLIAQVWMCLRCLYKYTFLHLRHYQLVAERNANIYKILIKVAGWFTESYLRSQGKCFDLYILIIIIYWLMIICVLLHIYYYFIYDGVILYIVYIMFSTWVLRLNRWIRVDNNEYKYANHVFTIIAR